MKTYCYLCFSHVSNVALTEPELGLYAKEKKLLITASYVDKPRDENHGEKRHIDYLFDHVLCAGDTLITYEPANLGRSVFQVVQVLEKAAAIGVDIHFVRSKMIFSCKKGYDIKAILAFFKQLGKDFSSRHTLDDLTRKTNSLKAVGRPKGKQNRKLKLDAHREDILKYLNLKISKSSIARLVNCHPQTLQEWIRKQNKDLLSVKN